MNMDARLAMLNNITLSIFSTALLLWSQASFAETVTDVSCYAEIKGEMVTLDRICIDRLRSPELTRRAMGR